METLQTQFEKQFLVLKHRLEQCENDNERLTNQNRQASKELLLYKNLLEAPNHPDPSIQGKDYQQLKSLIDNVMKENERLNNELQNFKTTDPVYEQVQLLERTNDELKQVLKKTNAENQQLKQMINSDGIQQLKLRLQQSLEECEQLKLLNEQLIRHVDREQQRHSSPSQVN